MTHLKCGSCAQVLMKLRNQASTGAKIKAAERRESRLFKIKEPVDHAGHSVPLVL